MTKPHILQVGPYPEWDQTPLDAAFHMHRYFEAADKAAYLAQHGMRRNAWMRRAEPLAVMLHATGADPCPNADHPDCAAGAGRGALKLASDRTQAMKAQVVFSE